MKGDGLVKLYDTLSTDELFRLRIRAMARGDRADCDRLDRVAMLRQYRAYCARLDASEVLTLCVLVELGQKLAKLEMLNGVVPLVELLEGAASDAAWLGYLDGYAAGWKAAGKRGQAPAVSDEKLMGASERAYGRGSRISATLAATVSLLAGKSRTPRDALAALAEHDLGVSLDDLLNAWAPGASETVAEHAEILEDAEADAAGIELHVEVLRRAWRRHALEDPTAEMDDALRERVDATLRGGAHDALDA